MERIWILHTSCITVFTPKVYLDQRECFIFGLILVLESVVAFGGNLLLIISLFKTKQVAPRVPRMLRDPFLVNPSNILTTALAMSDCLSACISMPLIIVMLLVYPKNTNCYLQFMSTFSAVLFIAASGLFTAFMNLEIYYGMDPDITGQNIGRRFFKRQNKVFWLVLAIVFLSNLCAVTVLTCSIEAVHKVKHLSIVILVAAVIIHSAILTKVVVFVHSVLRLRRHFEQNAASLTPNTPAVNGSSEETERNNQLPQEFYKARVTVALLVLICTISYVPCNLCIIVMSVQAYLGYDFLTKKMILIFATTVVLVFGKCVLNPMIIIYRNQRRRRWIRSKYITRREGVQQLPVMRTVQS